MSHFDVFNGDADGIFALVQLRRETPKAATLISGPKREIALLARVSAGQGDSVTVLDISLDRNRGELQRLLNQGAQVHYVDHHYAGTIPAGVVADIDTDSRVCTSLLVDKQLEGRQRLWALAGAYGDNLIEVADALAIQSGLNQEQRRGLLHLGTLVNYNGYGRTLADLHFSPIELYRAIQAYASPFALLADANSPVATLAKALEADLARAKQLTPLVSTPNCLVVRLPDEAWVHRVNGVLANRLANEGPQRAVALVSELPEGALRISLRAPLARPQGADALCRQFEGGGGRARAAGINALPEAQLPRFIERMQRAFGR
ncbi:DHH family phosphoesterase [Ferrimonas balearica]|uniref:DHHA1 domain-containing protein n=1 Tax=Ferrimonas balearica TaxID=44012 RepID=UPI001C9A0DC4|nr:DHH family phosphoesterase [Ferrimonas balearica]MBY5990803.1 DHH family phosphoesterase [Ferrimonas balearica]